jgi:hypothetical protein
MFRRLAGCREILALYGMSRVRPISKPPCRETRDQRPIKFLFLASLPQSPLNVRGMIAVLGWVDS